MSQERKKTIKNIKKEYSGEKSFSKSNKSKKEFKKEFKKETQNEFRKEFKNESRKDSPREFQTKFSKDYKTDNRKSFTQVQKNPNIMCPVYRKCGGCNLQHLSYENQLKEKQLYVNKLLSEYGKVLPIIGMKDPLHYRNKVHAVFKHTKRGIESGVFEEGTHEVVSVDTCYIENKKAREIVKSIRGLLKSFKIKAYDEDTGYGLLRYVLIRTGLKTGQIMVVLVLGSSILPGKNNFVKALRDLHPEISTIVLNVNEKKTSMVLGEKETVLYGKGFIEDELSGLTFRISPKSFYQVNPVQTEVLYHKAIELAGLTGKERVIDAYCGIGTIGLIASKKAKEVIGVELNKDAIKDANLNAKRNEIKNVSFYNNDAGDFMVQLADRQENIDVVFLDPPRAGSDEKFLSSVVALRPKKVVYISCHPESLARDLEYLTKNRYEVKTMVPVDMFPMTKHVETVCCLQRVNM